MDGDPESNYAYYCLHKLRMLPSQFLGLPIRERAYVIAAIDVKTENDKKEAAKIKSRKRKR